MQTGNRRKLMKKVQSDFILKFAFALALVLVSNATLNAQPQITAGQLATLQPLDPGAIPRFGTFWLLKSPDPGRGYPPTPCPPAHPGSARGSAVSRKT